ncbi:MAG TPA: PorP/SprF family type IX secretion system membrane protein [Bacteroidia bacterium]|jgi:type IX secretion system PorP/SprF family membrane protein|nr:PorP/SprF family type IX secretion system membrane protein [Bacteroidia bacterium]
MRLRIIIFFFSILIFSIKAQQPYFSSLNQNLLSVNPAFAGTNDKLRVQAITGRTGWPKYGVDNRSYYAGADFLAGKYSGLGLSFSSSLYNNSSSFKSTGSVLKEMQVDFSYALHLKINDKIKIVPAFQVSYFQITLNSALVTFDPNEFARSPFAYSTNENLGILTKRNIDFSSGLLVYGKRFYVGATILSFTQPDEGVLGVSKRPFTQIYQGKYRFGNLEKLNIDAYGFVKLQKVYGSFVQYGTYLNYKMLSLHLAHRINDNLVYNSFVAGVALNLKGMKIGYNNRFNYMDNLSNRYFNEFYLAYGFGKKNVEGEPTSIKLIN